MDLAIKTPARRRAETEYQRLLELIEDQRAVVASLKITGPVDRLKRAESLLALFEEMLGDAVRP